MGSSQDQLSAELQKLNSTVRRIPRPWDSGDSALHPSIEPVSKWVKGPEVAAGINRLEDNVPNRALREFGADKALELARQDHQPIPDPRDREGYWGDDHLMYWLTGLADYLALSERLPPDMPPNGSVLDFGCASGRASRHFLQNTDYVVHGADVNRRNISWLRHNLRSPRMRQFQTTYFPPLPLRDASIDFAFAFSVFTHIDDFEESWLAELHRVMRPGGHALLTVHTERTWNLLTVPDGWIRKAVLQREHCMVIENRPGAPIADKSVLSGAMPADRVILRPTEGAYQHLLILHSLDYLRRSFGKWFDIVDVYTHAHGMHQDGILLRR